jgi:hypothetical protein
VEKYHLGPIPMIKVVFEDFVSRPTTHRLLHHVGHGVTSHPCRLDSLAVCSIVRRTVLTAGVVGGRMVFGHVVVELLQTFPALEG